MSSTHFVNPNGRHNKNHYTTANDFKKLIVAIFKDTPQIKSYTMQGEFTFNGIRQWNRNRTLKQKNSIGLKTGFTPQSGFNLAACYELNNGIFCTVEFGAYSINKRKKHSLEIVEKQFRGKEVYSLDVGNEPIILGRLRYSLAYLKKLYLTDKGKQITASLVRHKNTNGADSAATIRFVIGETTLNSKAYLFRYNQTN